MEPLLDVRVIIVVNVEPMAELVFELWLTDSVALDVRDNTPVPLMTTLRVKVVPLPVSPPNPVAVPDGEIGEPVPTKPVADDRKPPDAMVGVAADAEWLPLDSVGFPAARSFTIRHWRAAA